MEEKNKPDIIIYQTADGKAAVSLYAKDGMVWMNQQQLAELFDTSKQNIGQHIAKILKEGELDGNSVVKYFFTTATDGKQYNPKSAQLHAIPKGYKKADRSTFPPQNKNHRLNFLKFAVRHFNAI